MLSFTLSPVTSYPKFMLSVPTDIVVPAALRHAKDSAPVQSMRKVFFSNPKNLFIAIPFLILFLLKIALEHSDGIWSVICLSMSFFYINQRIKNAACKFEPKWLACSTSAVGLLGLLCLQCAFRKEGVYRSLFCAPSYISSDDWVGLLWSILVTDFSLKLITMFLKSIVIALSPRPLGVYPRYSGFLGPLKIMLLRLPTTFLVFE
uniref:Uncharacterized protein n=1 Tax=Schistocephalus solidus TaxID=70667 RepID=A0A0X3PJF4_SCHSO